MKKLFAFSFILALASPMMAESLRIFKCTDDQIPGQSPLEPQLIGLAISADGHYVCGTIEQGAGVFVADSRTGEVKWTMGDGGGGELRSVDNDGVGIGFTDGGTLYSFATGELIPINAPAGVRSVLGEGISNNGAVKVGSFIVQSFDTEAAYCVADGEWKNLPIPTDEEKGNLKDFMNRITAAKIVSGDGSVILGHLGSFSFPIVWTRTAAGEYEADFFPARFVKAVEADRYDESKPLYGLSGMYICMSNNGRYVGAVGQVANEDNTAKRLVPVIYDTREKTIKAYSEPQEIDIYGFGMYPRAIADDGTFIGSIGSPADPAGNLGCFIWRAGEEQAELYIDAFPAFFETLGESDILGQNIPIGISADGRHIMGYSYYSEDYDMDSDAPAYYCTYVISLDGSGVEELTPASREATKSIWTIDGRAQTRLQKGLNIVRNADGTVTKILK